MVSERKVVYAHFSQNDSDGGSGGGDMLERVKRLENKVDTLAIDVAIIKSTMCTREDLHKELRDQNWKVVLAVIITPLIAILIHCLVK